MKTPNAEREDDGGRTSAFRDRACETATVRRLAQPAGEVTREGGLDDQNGKCRFVNTKVFGLSRRRFDAASCAGHRRRKCLIRNENSDPRRAGNLSL